MSCVPIIGWERRLICSILDLPQRILNLSENSQRNTLPR